MSSIQRVPNCTNGTNEADTASSSSPRILRVGIIGCGEIAQVVHIPTINFLSHRFKITYLCDISRQALDHCAKKVPASPHTTTDAEELCSSTDVDIVVVANADAYHVEHGIMALKHDKHCLVEKPLAVTFRDIDRIIEAEKTSRGKVFVGTMRRFAAAFVDAVEEVGGFKSIQYARVRDIIGPNPVFVGQSGTYPQKFFDISDTDSQELAKRNEDIGTQALGREFGVPVTPESRRMLRILGG